MSQNMAYPTFVDGNPVRFIPPCFFAFATFLTSSSSHLSAPHAETNARADAADVEAPGTRGTRAPDAASHQTSKPLRNQDSGPNHHLYVSWVRNLNWSLATLPQPNLPLGQGPRERRPGLLAPPVESVRSQCHAKLRNTPEVSPWLAARDRNHALSGNESPGYVYRARGHTNTWGYIWRLACRSASAGASQVPYVPKYLYIPRM